MYNNDVKECRNQEYQLTGIHMYNNDVIEWREPRISINWDKYL
jgi:hypothetical protein